MSSVTVKLKVSTQPGKKSIKKLPESIAIDSKTTVDDAKMLVARAAGVRDFNRIAVLDPSKKSIIKDRKAVLTQQKTVMDVKEIWVKDLGPQIAWKTVFIIEYLGPILIHVFIASLRPYIYKGVGFSDGLSSTQKIAFCMVVGHFIKRELETLMVHKFSASTMPAFNILKNSGHYWLLSGLNIAYWIYAPNAVAAQQVVEPLSSPFISVGLALYVLGESLNLYTHIVLSNLRTRGGTERGIPKGFSFNWVTCPNYLWEIISWIGVLLVTRSWGTAVFIVVAWAQMQQWAHGKEKRYRLEFGDKYQAKLFPLTPGIAYPIKKAKK